MDKITSFQIDHTVLTEGMYLSKVDDDIVTYDLRFYKPNAGTYLENDAMHTIEHLFATYVRNSPLAKHIIYFGPMGCRTGFYFLVRSLPHENSITLTQDALHFVVNYNGPIPGVSHEECGNYHEHNLTRAKREAEKMTAILKKWTTDNLKYPAKI